MTKLLPFVAFVEQVLGVKLTSAQRVLCRVAYDGAEPGMWQGEDRQLATQIFGPVESVPPDARHVVAIVAGARAGKSYLSALRLLYLALTVPLATLAPGEVAAALVVAPDMRLARQTARYVVGAVKSAKAIEARLLSESADGCVIQREGGRSVSIECLPATRGGSAVRGRSLVGAVLDECCFFRDESYSVNDAEVYKAIAPRIMPGGQLVLASTPFTESGLLYDLHRENFGHPKAVLAAHAPTTLLRPDARTARIVAQERERDPDNAAREFDAEFMSTAAGLFFDGAAIDLAIDRSLELPLQPIPGTLVSCGADFAFRTDSSALVVVHKVGDIMSVADIVEQRPSKGQPLKPSAVVAEFAASLKRHGALYLRSDAHYRQAIEEHLSEHSLLFVPAPEGATGKLETYTRARALLHEGRVKLPYHPRLLKQLREVVSRPTPGGGLSISSPRWRTGGHGDLVSALVLALHERSGTTTAAPSRTLTVEERLASYRRAEDRAWQEMMKRGDESALKSGGDNWLESVEKQVYGDEG